MGETRQARLRMLDGTELAYRAEPGTTPGVMFCGGFRSDMTGTKAAALEAACGAAGRAYVRFDYRGHGASSGRFEDATIGDWAGDAQAVLDHVARGPQVIVGSSMGGWIMLLLALARPDRVCGLIGVAAAPDFTEDLMWQRYDDPTRAALRERGVHYEPSAYDAQPYAITYRLIEEGRRHLVLGQRLAIDCPVRLLHGLSDPDVPYTTSLRLLSAIESHDATLTLVKHGDHRLSEPADLERLSATVAELCARG